MTPGTTLNVEAVIVHEGSGFAVTTARVRIESKLVCNCEITFRLVPFPNPQLRAAMLQRAVAIAFPMETVADV